MKIVRLMKDMPPGHHKGEDVVLPDEVASKALKNGDADNERPYPPQDVVFDPRVREQAKQRTVPVQPAPSFLTRAQRRAQQFGGRKS
jgi:hypothetical protein